MNSSCYADEAPINQYKLNSLGPSFLKDAFSKETANNQNKQKWSDI